MRTMAIGMVFLCMSVFSLSAGQGGGSPGAAGSGEDAALKPGAHTVHDSTMVDMPGEGEVGIGYGLQSPGTRGAIIPSNRPDGPIRIIFEQPVNQIATMGAILGRSLRLEFSPSVKGDYKWVSPTELAFTPAKNMLRPGTWLNVSLTGAVPLAKGGSAQVYLQKGWAVEAFSMGSKVSGYTVVPGKPRFVSTLDSGTYQVGAGMLNLLYDQVVDPRKMEIKATVNGKPLRTMLMNPVVLGFDWEQEYDKTHIIHVRFPVMPPQGSMIELEVPSLDEAGQPARITFQRQVNTEFSVSGNLLDLAASGQPVPYQGMLHFSFSNKLDFDVLRAQLSIEPRPLMAQLWRDDWENVVYLQYSFEPGVKYRASLPANFTDLLGNKLSTPLDVSFQARDLPPVLVMPKDAMVLETNRNRLPLKVRNVGKVTLTTWSVTEATTYHDLLESFPFSSQPKGIGKALDKKVSGSFAELEKNVVHTVDFGMGLDPGMKVVEVAAEGSGTEAGTTLRGYALVQSTDLGISAKLSEDQAFVWVTALGSAKPVADAQVRLLTREGREVGSGTSGKDGVVKLADLDLDGAEGSSVYLSAATKKDRAVLVIRDTELSNAWQFNLPGRVKGAGPLPAALFTERGAYRPGDTVHLKGIMRPDPLFDRKVLELQVRDPLGQTLVKTDLEPDAFRGVDASVDIAEGAPVGEYQAFLSWGNWKTRTTFRVEEYRVPTFQVQVSSRDTAWIGGKPASTEAISKYLQGALMGGSEIEWRVYRQPDDFKVDSLAGYVFTTARDPSQTGSVKTSRGVLNADSKSVFSFVPEAPGPEGPVRYIVQAAVTDTERQTYAGRMARTIHPAALYVGHRPPPRTVFSAGESVSVPLVVVDVNGRVQVGKTVEVALNRVEYHSTTLMDEEGGTETYSREVVETRSLGTVVSKVTPEPFKVSLDAPGAWELEFRVKDAEGRLAMSAMPLTISGDAPSSWPRFDRERIDIVLDKSSYKAGDTASLVVQSPFGAAEGLVTIEGEGVLDHIRFTIKDNTPAIKIPVKSTWAPNVFVSVILLRGRTHDLADASGYETGAPAYRVGYARMDVDAAERRLEVAVQPEKVEVKPGSTVNVSLSLKDWKGKKSGAASATVMVVDEAVLGLTSYRTPDPVALAYALRLLGIRNASNLLDLPHSRRSRFETLFPGGDSDASQPMPDADLSRRLFKSTAYWNPSVPVDADGTARISFTMPDNLTTWRVMAVAADSDGRMGSGQAAIRSNLPLMVQAVIPRFLYKGDELTIQSRVFNMSDKGGSAKVDAAWRGFKVSSSPAASLNLASKQDGLLGWKGSVEAEAGSKVAVSFAAALGTNSDSLQVEIPVLSAGNRRTLVESRNLGGTGTLEIKLPKDRLPGTGAYEVVLSASPLTELKDAVTYLMQYPNGCIEQTTSTAYPLVVLKDLLPAIGVEVNMADLKAFSEAGVKRILSFQTSSGGLAYWPDSNEPHAFATAFGLTCLLEAKKRGYDVPDTKLKGMADYLEATLRKGEIREDIPHGSIADGDTRALFVMTLGRMGRPQPAYIQELWRNKDKLTPFGLSFLAVAVRESGELSLLEPVLEAVRTAAKISSDEAWYELERKGGYSMDSPLRTHAGALLAYAVAGGKADMSGRLLKGLLARKTYGLWGNTQENVFGIMAVYTLVTSSSGGTAGGAASSTPAASAATYPKVRINGKDWTPATMENPSQNMFRVRFNDAGLGSAETIRVEVDTGGAPLFVTARASFDSPLDQKFMAETSNGFSLKRMYETVDGKTLSPDRIPLGSLVKVRLVLKVADSKNYVAIDDKLPAGFEALNMNLDTTDRSSMGTLSPEALNTLPSISYQEVRDHRVAFFVDAMTPGTWEFVYLAKASTPGTFLAPAGRAEAMYEPEFSGTSKVEMVTIK